MAGRIGPPARSPRARRGERHPWRRPRSALPLAFLSAALLGACGRRADPTEPPPTIVVFAAASLRDVLQEAAGEYERVPGHPRTRFNFGASGALARQLAAAPRADAFVAAGDEPVDELERRGLVAPGTRRVVATNRLVAIASPTTTAAPADACALAASPPERLFIADPASAPAGKYAQQYLERTRCEGAPSPWERLGPLVIRMPDVRAVLAQVESVGRAVGFVYRTDARSSPRVRVLFTASGPAAAAIRYPAVALAPGPTPGAGAAWVDFLASPTAAAIFAHHGFEPVPGGRDE